MSINNNNNNNHNIISKIAVVQYTPFQQPNPTFFSPPPGTVPVPVPVPVVM